MKWLLLALFAALTPLANWMIGNVGTTCIPNGPCLIPVGFGMMSPSGVLVIGIALVLRDFIQEKFGKTVSLYAIGLGSAASFFTSTPEIAIASAVAFAVAELMDFGVYTKLREQGAVLAVACSGVVGSLIDSALFVYIAFGSFDFSVGNTIGKLYATALAVVVIYAKKRMI